MRYYTWIYIAVLSLALNNVSCIRMLKHSSFEAATEHKAHYAKSLLEMSRFSSSSSDSLSKSTQANQHAKYVGSEVTTLSYVGNEIQGTSFANLSKKLLAPMGILVLFLLFMAAGAGSFTFLPSFGSISAFLANISFSFPSLMLPFTMPNLSFSLKGFTTSFDYITIKIPRFSLPALPSLPSIPLASLVPIAKNVGKVLITAGKYAGSALMTVAKALSPILLFAIKIFAALVISMVQFLMKMALGLLGAAAMGLAALLPSFSLAFAMPTISSTMMGVLAGAAAITLLATLLPLPDFSCSRDYSFRCPMAWSEAENNSNLCIAPSSYDAGCSSIMSFGSLTAKEKSVVAKDCKVSYPCLKDTCSRDYLAPCPASWVELPSGECVTPPFYSDVCKGAHDLREFDSKKKEKFSISCSSIFPCKRKKEYGDCKADYSFQCPLTFEVQGEHCINASYTGPCNKSNFLNLQSASVLKKEYVAAQCGVYWPCSNDLCTIDTADYDSPCPRHWVLDPAKEHCIAPQGYISSSNCPRRMTRNGTIAEKKDFAKRCKQQWRCPGECIRNYDLDCPIGWVSSQNGYCSPFINNTTANSKCSEAQNFENMSYNDKVVFEYLCQNYWPCADDKSNLLYTSHNPLVVYHNYVQKPKSWFDAEHPSIEQHLRRIKRYYEAYDS